MGQFQLLPFVSSLAAPRSWLYSCDWFTSPFLSGLVGWPKKVWFLGQHEPDDQLSWFVCCFPIAHMHSKWVSELPNNWMLFPSDWPPKLIMKPLVWITSCILFYLFFCLASLSPSEVNIPHCCSAPFLTAMHFFKPTFILKHPLCNSRFNSTLLSRTVILFNSFLFFLLGTLVLDQ